MANSIINSAVVSKEYLRQYYNTLVLGNLVNYSKSSEFGKGDNKIGTSVRIKREIISGVRFNDLSWTTGVAAGVADTMMTFVNLVIDSTISAFMSMSDADLTLKLEDFSAQIIKPRAKRMANQYDLMVSSAVINATVGNSAFGGSDQFGVTSQDSIPGYAAYTFGTAGAGLAPNDVLNAKRALLEIGADEADGLQGVLSPYAQQTLLQANATLFNTYVEDGVEYKNGRVGSYAGIDWVTTASLSVHTNGALSAVTPTGGEMTTGWVEFSKITVPALSAAVNPGDVFTVPGVYQVNRINKQVTTIPFQVTVLAAAAATATSLMTSPIITGGNYQNASATCMNKTWTLLGSVGSSCQESLLLTEDAIYGAVIELDTPGGFDQSYQIKSDDVKGVKMRLLRKYDDLGVSGVNGTQPAMVGRIDMAFGIKVVNPEKIVRIRA